MVHLRRVIRIDVTAPPPFSVAGPNACVAGPQRPGQKQPTPRVYVVQPIPAAFALRGGAGAKDADFPSHRAQLARNARGEQRVDDGAQAVAGQDQPHEDDVALEVPA